MPASNGLVMPGKEPNVGSERMGFDSRTLPLEQKARVLIPRFDTFGDIVIFESFLAAIRRQFPDMDLCLLVRKGYDELASLFPAELELRWLTVDQHAYKSPNDQKRSEFVQTLKKLVAEGWDTVLLTAFNRTWLDELLLEEFSGVSTILLGSEADVGALSTATRVVVPVNEWSHETDKYRVLLEKLAGDAASFSPPRLEVPATLAKEASQELARLNLESTPFVACLSGGTQNNRYKVWPLERFADVLGWLKDCHGLVPLLIGHELEEAPIRSLAEMLSSRGVEARIWLGHDGGIPMLGALLQQAALYVGNDSGPMHIAAGLGVPVVGVFGGGCKVRFVPANKQAVAVLAEIPCFGCYWQCIFGDAPCMRLVDVESVKTAVESVMKNEVPADRVLNVGARLPVALIEIVERAKAEYGKRKAEFEKREQNLRDALIQERAKNVALQKSLSWRLTAPFRKLLARL